MSADLRTAVAEVASRLGRVADGKTVGAGPLTRPAPGGRLASLAEAFGLEELDLDLLVVAAAVELDRRFDALLRRVVDTGRVSAGLALELCGADPWSAPARARLSAAAPLVRTGLLEVDAADRPFPSRPLQVPDRVVAHLLGDDVPAVSLRALVTRAVPADLAGADDLARALAAGVPIAWIRERGGTAGTSMATTALARLGLPVVVIDLQRLPALAGLGAVAVDACREAALRGGGLVIGGVRVERDHAAVSRLDDPPCPVVLVADGPWDPAWSSTVPYVIEAVDPGASARRAVWDDVLRRLEVDGAEVPTGVEAFRLVPEQIVGAAASAAAHAAGAGRAISRDDVLAGVRAQNAGRLDHLARRVVPAATFDGLVVPTQRRVELESIVRRARLQERVRGEWGMGGGGARRGQGVTCLFAGPSGTGKTLAAEVIARELGVDLYTIDLSQVVDKYIGETEKNLERIFVEAEGVNGVLFFDEADALFGKRSDVKDAHDRHANIEVAYLLQRMERFDGVAILATNLRGNLDDAFSRRIDVICHFAQPEEDERLRLWQLHLPPTLPVTDDLDLPYLAKAVDVPGGVIRNITLSAAYTAAADDRPVGMADLVHAVAREYRKMGRLIRAADLGMYGHLLSNADLAEVDTTPSADDEGDR